MLYEDFETSIMDNSGMEQLDAIVIGPVEGKLLLELTRVDTSGSASPAEDDCNEHDLACCIHLGPCA